MLRSRLARHGLARLFQGALCATVVSAASAQGLAVAGRVVDALSGAPLARATISLEPDLTAGMRAPAEKDGRPPSATLDSDGPRSFRRRPPAALASVVTGADGHFQFGDVAPGRYRLLAARRGYLSSTLGQHGSFFNAVVVGPSAAGADAIRFAMQPMASIRGTIEDSTGDPVQSASIALFARGFDGKGTVRSARRTFLEQNGSTYRLDDLAPGTYYVAVSGRPWFAQSNVLPGNQPNPLDVVYPTTFWDGAVTSDGAEPIMLQPGDTADANFSLHAIPALHISLPLGQSGSFSFSPTAFGAVFPVSPMLSVYNADGNRTVEAAVAPGSYVFEHGGSETSLDITGDTSAPIRQNGPATVPLGGELAMADGSRLPPGSSLLLEPVHSGGGRSFSFIDNGGDNGVSGLQQRDRGVLKLEADTNGMLRSQPVPTGDYRLDIDGGSGSPRLVITAGAAQGATLSADLVLHIDTQPVMLAATLAEPSGVVSGTAPGAGDAMILLVPENAYAASLYRLAESATDGSWSIENVVPGKYRVLAIHDGWDLDWKTPEVLARYAAGAVAVTVAPRTDAQVSEPVMAQAR